MLLASDLSQALDPVLFAKEALSFTPDPWQEKALRWSGKRLLLNCSRQSGKSTTAAILALHRAIFYPSSRAASSFFINGYWHNIAWQNRLTGVVSLFKRQPSF
jgi:hypothetical protein